MTTVRDTSFDVDGISVTRLGEISPLGRYCLAQGAFLSDKYRPNGASKVISKNRPKFTSIIFRFGLLFVFKLSYFDQKFLWAKVLTYHFGRFLVPNVWSHCLYVKGNCPFRFSRPAS
jgi:hypothetical protein